MAKNMIVFAKKDGEGHREEVTTELSEMQVELMYLRLGYNDVKVLEGTVKKLGKGLAYLNRQYGL